MATFQVEQLVPGRALEDTKRRLRQGVMEHVTAKFNSFEERRVQQPHRAVSQRMWYSRRAQLQTVDLAGAARMDQIGDSEAWTGLGSAKDMLKRVWTHRYTSDVPSRVAVWARRSKPRARRVLPRDGQGPLMCSWTVCDVLHRSETPTMQLS